MNVDEHVLSILAECEMDGQLLHLSGQLDRPTYQKVAKVLTLIGGEWNRKAKAHVFPEGTSAADAVERVLLTGEVSNKKQDFGQFYTPYALAAELVAELGGVEGLRVLEPNVGRGAIMEAVLAQGAEHVTGYDIDPANIAATAKMAQHHGERVFIREVDFLTVRPRANKDAIAMNPPFSRQADIKHVMHASKFLRPGGRLASIMSAAVMFREDRLTVSFRKQVAEQGNVVMRRLPTGSFKSAGTGVEACLIAFDIVQPLHA